MGRSLLKNWKLNAIAVFSLTIAMALTVIALSFSNAILLRPPIAREPERVVLGYTVSATGGQENISYLDYQYIRDHARSFSAVGAANYGFSKEGLGYAGRDEFAMVNTVSDNYFELMGMKPFLGRFFTSGDDQKPQSSVVLTYSCWKRWGGDREIVGKTLTSNNHTLTIIGVAPKEFIAARFGVGADVIKNISSYLDDQPAARNDRTQRYFFLIGRLAPGVNRAQARAELQTLWNALAAVYPDEEMNRKIDMAGLTILPPDEIADARLMAGVLVAVVLLILLIACANTANLLLALATQRRQEALIKTALGASRSRLIGEFLKETVVLCAMGGVLGYALASVMLRWMSRFDLQLPAFGTIPVSMDLHPGALVTALTLGIILLASVASGLAPALYASKPNLASALSGEIVIGGTRRGLIRNFVVVVQVAVCTLVLVGTGLCLRSLQNLRSVDPGFSARRIVAFLIFDNLRENSKNSGMSLMDELRREAQQTYGVESVSLSNDLPLGGDKGDNEEVRFTDRPPSKEKIFIDSAIVDENYFSTLGIKVLAGRTFRPSDQEKSPAVIVINHFMAEKYWPGQDPVGRTIQVIDRDPGGKTREATVIGVVADGKYVNFDDPPQSFFYLALSQRYTPGGWFIARTNGDPRLWIEPLSKTILKLGLKLPLPPTTMDGWMNLTLFVPLLTLGCVSVLSVLAVLLATVGLYGAISYSVSERRKEMGIRIALGARPGQIMKLVFRETMLIVGIGVIAGIALGVAAQAILRTQFYGIHRVEWLVLTPVAVAMIAVSLGIAFAAARRWTLMNPMDAVRHA